MFTTRINPLLHDHLHVDYDQRCAHSSIHPELGVPLSTECRITYGDPSFLIWWIGDRPLFGGIGGNRPFRFWLYAKDPFGKNLVQVLTTRGLHIPFKIDACYDATGMGTGVAA